MNDPLPFFPYHPDPVATGAVVLSSVECRCCGRARGYAYARSPYCQEDGLDGKICPWCIADGSAAVKFNAEFCDVHNPDTFPEYVAEELAHRTPGYESWQGEDWLIHCADACEFHGDASVEDVKNASPATKQDWMARYGLGETDWEAVTEDYKPIGDPALYKFICRHCQAVLFGMDFT